SSHALGRWRLSQTRGTEGTMIRTCRQPPRTDVVGIAIMSVVVTVIVTRQLPTLDDVQRGQLHRYLASRNDVARYETPSRRRLDVNIVVITAAGAVHDSGLRALWRCLKHRSWKGSRGGQYCGRRFMAAVVAEDHLHQRFPLADFAATAAPEVTAGRRKQVRIFFLVSAQQFAPVPDSQRLHLC